MSAKPVESATRRKHWRAARASCAAIALVVALGACSSDDNDDAASAQQEEIDDLNAQLAAETKRADDAEAQLVEIASQFPVTIGASLDGFDLIGPYTLSMTEAYCDGLSTCGQGRPDVHADIIQGPNGLELQIPTVFTTGLFDVNGSLFAVTDSDKILAPCGATARLGRISITIFADGITIAADGERTLSGLGASLLVSTDAIDDCTAGVVFFAAKLTPL